MDSITVSGVGKAYRDYPNRWSRLREWVSLTSNVCHTKNWVVRNISFSIPAGAAIGLVGVNGAGKSTLLKMVAGVSSVSEGRIEVIGSVSAILELGLAFHPDFTGRQNARLAGMLLGHSHEEMDALMPDIAAFSEIGDYLDRPVRTYSTGMQVRLAFSVATARRPDILLVDEALSVGDVSFQQKSFARIRSYRELGSTLVLVSHDKTAIQSICDSVILLDRGRVIDQGAPAAMFDLYNALIADPSGATLNKSHAVDGRSVTVSGTGQAKVSSIKILPEGSDVEAGSFIVGAQVVLEVQVVAHADIERLIFGYMVRDRLGQVVYGTNTHHTGNPLCNVKSGSKVMFRLSFSLNIGPGKYSISTALVSSDTHLDSNYEWMDQAHQFEVLIGERTYFEGSTWLEPSVEVVI
jgi:lipopolysaccharide transport system ATP-binding protein